MKVYTDSEGRILAVGTTDDDSLIELTINDDEQNPFIGWSDAKIMCYRVEVDENGFVTMMTPYVPSNLIDKISQMQTDIKTNSIDTGLNTEGLIVTNNTIDMILTEILPTLLMPLE